MFFWRLFLADLGPHFQICRFRILPLIALSVITGLATFGYVNIPMAMSGELFPLETKVAATRYGGYCQALKAACCLYHLKWLTFQPLCGIFQHCDLCGNSLYVCSGEKQSLPDGRNRNSWHVFHFRWSCPLLWGLQLLPNARDSWQITARDSIDIQPEENWSQISSLKSCRLYCNQISKGNAL